MTDINRLNSLLKDECTELGASLDALAEKHGHYKATLAMALHNSGVICAMLRRSGIRDDMMAIVKRQLTSLIGLAIAGTDIDQNEIVKIANGIDEQCALMVSDIREATGVKRDA